MADLSVRDILRQFSAAKTARSVWESTWQEIIDYLLPRRKPVTGSESAGTKRGSKIYNSEPTMALMRLAASLNSLLTNPGSQWFRLETDDEELNKQRDVKEWLEACEKRLRVAFESSNFGTESHEFYIDLPSFCTATIFMRESDKPGVDLYFSALHIREVYIAENKYGDVDQVFRVRDMTARQVKDEFGDKTPDVILKEYKDGDPEKSFPILNAVYPRTERNENATDVKNMPWASVWIYSGEGVEKGDGIILKESGYRIFPFAVCRWTKSTGEKYGRGPGLDTLADNKTLQKQEQTFLRNGQRVSEPPLNVPTETYTKRVSLAPGYMNYYDSSRGNPAKIEPINTGANLNITDESILRKVESIREGFYTTQLQLINRNEMTAEEVRQRTEENMRVLGPTFGRLQGEFLGPIVRFGYMTLFEAGKLPPAPESLIGREMMIRYVSPLAKAQQLHEVQAVTYTMQTAQAWSERFPDVVDNLDADEAIRLVADLDGTPTRIMRDKKKVKKLRDDRVAQVEAAQQAELNRQNAGTAKDLMGAAASAEQGGGSAKI